MKSSANRSDEHPSRSATKMHGRSRAHRRMETLTFIDLETTGFHPVQDAIIEFGAVRWDNGRITDTFREFANPGTAIPEAVTRLTGIRDEDVKHARHPGEVMEDFLDFVGATTCVAHNASFESKWLATKSSGRFSNVVLDSLTLARIALPRMPHHNLEALVRHYKLADGTMHRALSDAKQTAAIWPLLMHELENMSLGIIREMKDILAHTGHPLGGILAEVEKKLLAIHPMGKHGAYADEFVKFAQPRQYQADGATETPTGSRPIALPALESMFEEGGPLGAGGPCWENRPQQRRMAQAVAEAFNQSDHLLVEAGTGIGKSLAYLVPAVLWAVTNKQKVIVSTNTKNLQTQLFHKDLPLLHARLGHAFQSALLKGKHNYLCLWKFLEALRDGPDEVNAWERDALLSVIAWAAQTDTGDLSEVSLLERPDYGNLRDRLTIQASECTGRDCEYFQQCFLFQARAQAQEADIVVTNHALVMTDLGQDAPSLPAYKHIIFDEAHNLEHVATECMGVTFLKWPILRLLNRLHTESHRGLLARLRTAARKYASKQLNPATSLGRLCDQAASAVDACREGLHGFEASILALHPLGHGDAIRKTRLTEALRGRQEWRDAVHAKCDLIRCMGLLRKHLQDMLRVMEDIIAPPLERQALYARRIGAQEMLLADAMTAIEFLVNCDQEEFVYWLETRKGNRPLAQLRAVPIDVSSYLDENLFQNKDTAILCSATLQVRQGFHFLATRLGLERNESTPMTLGLGTPFDYARQATLLIPSFLPDPGRHAREYVPAVASFTAEWMAHTQGRGMFLFTSYELMHQIHRAVKDNLGRHGITVLCQGRDGGRDQILRAFRQGRKAVLLGTASFWEGIDVTGEALSFLGITRLPFPVFTEPVHQARCEDMERKGHDSFTGLSLPSAMIRFKQGFGRLIRSKTDRGVVAVLDNRIIHKNYGRMFLKEVPCPYHVCKDMQAFLCHSDRFMAQGSAADRV